MFTLAGLKLLIGPLLGMVGAAWQARESRLVKELELKDRALERAHELAIGQQEADNALKKEVIVSDRQTAQANMDAFSASYSFANKPMLPEGAKLTGWHKSLAVVADTLTALIRPGMTVYYQFLVLGLMVYVTLLLNRLTGAALEATVAGEIFREVVYSILMLAETTLLWWFGIRQLSTRGKK